MSKFKKVYGQLNEAAITQKTAFSLNKRLDNNNKDLEKLRKEYDKLINTLASDKDLFDQAKKVKQAFGQLTSVLNEFKNEIKTRM